MECGYYLISRSQAKDMIEKLDEILSKQEILLDELFPDLDTSALVNLREKKIQKRAVKKEDEKVLQQLNQDEDDQFLHYLRASLRSICQDVRCWLKVCFSQIPETPKPCADSFKLCNLKTHISHHHFRFFVQMGVNIDSLLVVLDDQFLLAWHSMIYLREQHRTGKGYRKEQLIQQLLKQQEYTDNVVIGLSLFTAILGIITLGITVMRK